MYSPSTLLRCFLDALMNTINHDGIEHAGYLAFLGLLAMFPFLVLVIALAGFIGEGQVGAHFISEFFSYLPPHMVTALEPRIVEITSGAPPSLLTVSILGAIWTASSAVEGYRTVLNRAYHVATPPAYIWRRMISILQILIFSFIVLMGMFLLVVLPVLWQQLAPFAAAVFSENGDSWTQAIYILVALTLLVLVANLYYVLPNLRQSFLSVLPGAVLTVLLWLGAAKLFSYYLSRFQQVQLIYGSLGGIIATLLFFYILNVLFIYGAELNYLLKKMHGDRMVQREAATTELFPPPQGEG